MYCCKFLLCGVAEIDVAEGGPLLDRIIPLITPQNLSANGCKLTSMSVAARIHFRGLYADWHRQNNLRVSVLQATKTRTPRFLYDVQIGARAYCSMRHEFNTRRTFIVHEIVYQYEIQLTPSLQNNSSGVSGGLNEPGLLES